MSRPGPPVVLGISFTALAAGMFSIVSFGTLAPELQTGLGLSRAAIGLLASLIFVGALLSSRPAGRLTDSTGPGGVLGLALCGLAGAMALAAASPAAAPFMAAAFIAGLAYGGVNPATNVIVAGQLARRLGFFLSVKQSGVPVGGLVAGILLPPVALAFGWRVALLVPVLVCLAVAAATPLLRGAAVLAASEDGPDRPWRRADQFALGFFGFAMSGTQWAFLSYLTLYLTEEIEFSLYPAGLALALAQGFGAGGRLAWGWLSDREGRRLTVLLLMCLTALASLAALASGIGEPMVWPIVAVCGFAIVGWNGAYFALLAEQAGPGRVGRVSGEALVFVFAGPVVVPPALGLLVDSTGSWQAMWGAAAVAVAVSASVLWAVLRNGLRVVNAPRSL